MGVQFDTDYRPPTVPQNYPGQMNNSNLSGIGGWLQKKGIVSSEAGAKQAMMGIVVFNFVVMALLVYFFL